VGTTRNISPCALWVQGSTLIGCITKPRPLGVVVDLLLLKLFEFQKDLAQIFFDDGLLHTKLVRCLFDKRLALAAKEEAARSPASSRS
jgi:hypothetical protein